MKLRPKIEPKLKRNQRGARGLGDLIGVVSIVVMLLGYMYMVTSL